MTRLTTHYDGEATRRFGLAAEAYGVAERDETLLFGAARQLEEACRRAAQALGVPLDAVIARLAVAGEDIGVTAAITLESPAEIEALLRLRDAVEQTPPSMVALAVDNYMTRARA